MKLLLLAKRVKNVRNKILNLKYTVNVYQAVNLSFVPIIPQAELIINACYTSFAS